MTQAEKLRIIADAMEGKCKIEVFYEKEWYLLSEIKVLSNRYYFITIRGNYNFEVNNLIEREIRIAKSLPLLSDADADFAEKYLPHDWWIARDKILGLKIHVGKPIKDCKWLVWYSETKKVSVEIPTFPKFESIKWEDEDCFTIQELLDYYRDQKK